MCFLKFIELKRIVAQEYFIMKLVYKKTNWITLTKGKIDRKARIINMVRETLSFIN